MFEQVALGFKPRVFEHDTAKSHTRYCGLVRGTHVENLQ